MTAGSIVIDLVMRTGMFETDTKRAEKRLQQFQKRAKQVGVAVGTAIAGTATAVAVLTKKTIDYAAEVERLSTLSNTSTEKFQRWAAGASMVGIEQDKLADILKDTQDKVGDFIQTGGGAMADFFEQIAPRVGVTAEQFRKLSGPDALQLYVDSLDKANLSQSDMVFYMEAIASDSSLLLPLLRNNAEGMKDYGDMAERLGAVMSGDLINAADLAREELTKLDLVKQGLVNRIVEGVLPALTGMTSRLVETAEKTDFLDKVARVAVTGMKLLTSAGIIVGGIFKTVGEAIGGVGATVVELVQGNFKRAWDISRQFQTDIVTNIAGTVESVKAVWEDVEIDATPVSDAADRDVRKLAPRIVKEGGKAIVSEAEKIYKRVEDVLARIGRDIATFGMTDEQVQLFDLKVMGADPEQLARAESMLTRLGILRKDQEKLRADIDQEDRARGVLGDIELEIEALGKSAVWIAKRNALIHAGVDAESEFGKAITESIEELYRQGEAIDKQIEAMDGLRGAARGFLDDLREGVGIWDALKNAADRFADVLFEIAAQGVIEQLFGKQGDVGGGTWGDAIGGILGAFFGGSKASGGDTLPNRGYWVGEQGPEWFQPRTAGTILTASDSAAAMHRGSGRSMAVTQNFYNPVMRDRTTDAQHARREARKAQRDMLRA